MLIEEKDSGIKKAVFGAISAARQAGQSEVYAFILTDKADAFRRELQNYGVEKIVAVSGPGMNPPASPDQQARALSCAVDDFRLDALLGLASAAGKDLLARIASLRGAPLVLDCLEVDFSRGVVKKSHFSGRAAATLQLKGRPWILGIRPNVFPEIIAPREAEVLIYQPRFRPRVDCRSGKFGGGRPEDPIFPRPRSSLPAVVRSVRQIISESSRNVPPFSGLQSEPPGLPWMQSSPRTPCRWAKRAKRSAPGFTWPAESPDRCSILPA